MDGKRNNTALSPGNPFLWTLILILSLLLSSCAGSGSRESGLSLQTTESQAIATAVISSETSNTLSTGDVRITAVPTDTPAPVPVKDAGQNDNVPENGNKYIMELTLDTESKSIGGQMTVIVRNTSTDTWDKLVFRDYPSLFTPETDTGYTADGRVTDIGEIWDITESEILEYSRSGEDVSVLNVSLKTPLVPGDMRKITLSFTAYIPNIESRYGYRNNTYNIANFYPVLAVYEDGAWSTEKYFQMGECFYSVVSDYDVTISAPSDMTVIASGETTGITPASGTRIWNIFAPGVRDFAMTAGSDFGIVSEIAAGITVNSYYMNGDISWGDEVLDAGVQAVLAFESEYGNYPYPELDIVETYLDAGGMEYPNLVMIANSMAAEGSEDSLLKIVVAHEVAHQWFYGIVGDNQFTEAWLDESFASYSELVYKKSYMSDAEIKAEIDAMEAALDPEGIFIEPGNYFINLPYDEFKGPFVYVSCVYWRGEVFLYRLKEAMGEDAFGEAIKEYYKDYSMKIATTEDFVAVITKYAGDNQAVQLLLQKYLKE